MSNMITSIQKWGNSNAIRIPKSILDAVRFFENDKVEIIADESEIIIKKASRKYSNLDDLFADYDGDYKCTEADTGAAIGKEVF